MLFRRRRPRPASAGCRKTGRIPVGTRDGEARKWRSSRRGRALIGPAVDHLRELFDWMTDAPRVACARRASRHSSWSLGFPRTSKIAPLQGRRPSTSGESAPEDREKPGAEDCREAQKRDPHKPAPARNFTVWIVWMGRFAIFAIIAVAGAGIMTMKDRRPPRR